MAHDYTRERRHFSYSRTVIANDKTRRMKYCILFAVGLILTSCNDQHESLEVGLPKIEISTSESKLLNQIEFDISLMSELKEYTQSPIVQLSAIDEETSEMIDSLYNGVYSICDEEKAVTTVNLLKRKFRESGYLIFTTENNNGEMSVAVIKGSDDLEILSYRKTNGINYDLESGDILNKITKWKKDYGLTIVGCSASWVEIKFERIPNNLDSFAKQVYEFCPDSVDQGVGSIESLIEYIKEIGGLWLWWD